MTGKKRGKKIVEARQFLEANRAKLVLHTLYTIWGLPTKDLLRPKMLRVLISEIPSGRGK